jgi:HlyD family secretion protein
MTTTDQSLSRLSIPAGKKTRRTAGPMSMIIIVLALLAGLLFAFFQTKKDDRAPIPSKKTAAIPAVTDAPAPPAKPGDVVLTVTGYVIPRERIEISPRFQGTVKLITVKKGDTVTKDQVLVQLEDDEYRARRLQAQGQLALAEANLKNAEVNLKRQLDLVQQNVDSIRARDDAQRARDAAAAEVTVAKGLVDLAETYVNWCTIRAPIDGTILEKLVNPNELVVPLSFGGGRGPSTAFLAMADLNDLQVEIDLNEADLSKIHMKQNCRVTPEAYPAKQYTGVVAEIAPEANRSKGTLQVKVQIKNPDAFLTPELTAKVDFLKE